MLPAAFLLVSADGARPPDLPGGYSLSLYAAGVDDARSLTLNEDGSLTVFTSDSDRIFSVAPARPDEPAVVMEIAAGLLTASDSTPAGAFHATGNELSLLAWDANSSQLSLVRLPSRQSDPPPRAADAALGQLLDTGLLDGYATLLTAEGELLIADRRAGAIYRVRAQFIPAPARSR